MENDYTERDRIKDIERASFIHNGNLEENIIEIKYSHIESVPFDVGKELLESQFYRIISLEENARLRIQNDKHDPISTYGNWTREGVLHIPEKGIFLTKKSPLMLNPKEATQAHRKKEEYYLTRDQIDESLADAVQLNKKSIPTNRFNEEPIMVYAFGNVARDYGLFLKEAGIKEMPINLTDRGKKPFARQVMFQGSVDGDLNFSSDYMDLYFEVGSVQRQVYKSRISGLRNFIDTIKSNEDIFRNVILDLKNNFGNRPNQFEIPKDLDPNANLEEIINKQCATGNRIRAPDIITDFSVDTRKNIVKIELGDLDLRLSEESRKGYVSYNATYKINHDRSVVLVHTGAGGGESTGF